MFKKLKIVLALASLSISLCLMSNTYSRYVADATGNVNVEFAKWQLLVNNTDITSNANSSMNFTPTILPSENVEDGYLAPSSKGYFDIVINPANVNVSFNYAISLTPQNQNLPDLIITKYSIIDANYQEGQTIPEIALTGSTITGDKAFDKTTTNFAFQPFTVRIYFEWFEGTDGETTEAMDNAADTAVEGETFTINATVSFSQII